MRSQSLIQHERLLSLLASVGELAGAVDDNSDSDARRMTQAEQVASLRHTSARARAAPSFRARDNGRSRVDLDARLSTERWRRLSTSKLSISDDSFVRVESCALHAQRVAPICSRQRIRSSGQSVMYL